MERESAKAHRLCPVGISLCLSCLATEAAARAVGQGLLLMAPHREAGLRLTPPPGPWKLLPVWGPNGSKWMRSCAYGFSVWGPLQALRPSSPLPSPHSSSLPGCLLLTPPFSLSPSTSTLVVPDTNGPWPLGPTEQGTDLLYPCCFLVTSPHLPQAQLSPTSALTTL